MQKDGYKFLEFFKKMIFILIHSAAVKVSFNFFGIYLNIEIPLMGIYSFIIWIQGSFISRIHSFLPTKWALLDLAVLYPIFDLDIWCASEITNDMCSGHCQGIQGFGWVFGVVEIWHIKCR